MTFLRLFARFVKGLFRNRLARAQMRKLKIYAGPEHPHEAQAPSELKVEA